MREQLVDLFKSSAIIQGTMALLGFGAMTYLAIAGRPIPEILAALVGTIVGYYFGTKTRQNSV